MLENEWRTARLRNEFVAYIKPILLTEILSNGFIGLNISYLQNKLLTAFNYLCPDRHHTMGRMHSDAQFAGSSSVPAHVEMMGFLGMGNNLW